MQYAAESNTDFSERGQSPDYRFLRTRLESRIPIFGLYGSLPCAYANNCCKSVVSPYSGLYRIV